MNYLKCKVAVIGEGMMVPTVVCCLLRAGHQVKSFTPQNPLAQVRFLANIAGFSRLDEDGLEGNFEDYSELSDCAMVLAITREREEEKAALLKKIEKNAKQDTLIALNTESITLDELQNQMQFPCRLVGLNWTYPAHQNLFAEVIINPLTDREKVKALMILLREAWDKDPYLLESGNGIRSRLMAAMAREAFFLIENGYVKVADIDRACRNDPGYYLPYAGNCRYMDLMGTFVYGVVMKDLNPELSRTKNIPGFFAEMVKQDSMKNASERAHQAHSSSGLGKLEISFLEFSRKMRALMEKYPFPRSRTSEEELTEIDQGGFRLKNRDRKK
ncbi:3-hydroxybutyryl-CoA dehydrogenase [Cyclobacterium lianum]|uniref:3-hydroxybutyryl-CoA dehydrogenase n=1 Tax=Cyclobacterium lianum TaxID=388280 RepID=A0A1M7PC00_9BACT|nr:3-hydroxyacyl-CoA dehydrogenase NAD-binding domain-containing protein [Cyclobacterium lianum]SHN14397.1 3-hydroxybutyryl-CoA dehydrogenase [Cyclobacterium lianum]